MISFEARHLALFHTPYFRPLFYATELIKAKYRVCLVLRSSFTSFSPTILNPTLHSRLPMRRVMRVAKGQPPKPLHSNMLNHSFKNLKNTKNTYNSGYSLIVTDLTTNQPVS